MEKNEIKYGDPKMIQTLAWHDESKKDYLIVIDQKPRNEVMNARAKGTTIYELIDIYGGVDNVSEAFSAKEALYADVGDMPEFANDESYQKILADLAAKVSELQKQQEPKPQTEALEKEGQEEK